MSSVEHLIPPNSQARGHHQVLRRPVVPIVPDWRERLWSNKEMAILMVSVFSFGFLVIGLVSLDLAFAKPSSSASKIAPTSDTTTKEPLVGSSSSLNLMLPKSVVPEHYDIELQPFLDNATFSGKVRIYLKVLEDTDNVTVHISNIDVHRDSVKFSSVLKNSSPGVKNASYDVERQFYVVKFHSSLNAGQKYLLEMTYNGSMRPGYGGFYRSSYVDRDGKSRNLAATQFQASSARRAFPCFDEPGFKATFNMTLVRPKNFSSMSNMPIYKSETRDGGWVADHFALSVRMSTYLVAAVVSDLKGIGTSKFAVWCREDVIKNTAYALEIGPKILKYFEDLFDIPYTLPKLDNVAIPDRGSGAMENWGLILYGEILLYDRNWDTLYDKKNTATTISHELAHQWLGNLVTLQWWNETWLNEGFATYYQYIGLVKVHRDWEMEHQFVVDVVQRVLRFDLMGFFLPLSHPVMTKQEIDQIFNRVSYMKGAVMVHMMSHFLGRNVFLRGLRNYLKAKKYGSVVQDELFHFLTLAQSDTETHVDVKKVMDTWTLKSSYPLVSITRNYSSGTATVTQAGYSGVNDTSPLEELPWQIPLTYTTQNKPDWTTKPKKWLTKSKDKLDGLPGPNHWLLANIDQAGLYRVHYDEHNWVQLMLQLTTGHKVIHALNRAQIIDDVMEFAKARLMNYNLALNATLYLANETSYAPWKSLFNSYHYLDGMLRKTIAYGKWKKYFIKRFEPSYYALRLLEHPNEPITKQYLRYKVAYWLCKYGHEHCVKEAISLFKVWKTDTSNSSIISPNLRGLVYCTAVKHGSLSTWDFIFEMLKKAKNKSEKENFLNALSCTLNTTLLERIRNWTMTPNSMFSTSESRKLLASLGGKAHGWSFIFNVILTETKELIALFGSKDFSDIVKPVAILINKEAELKQLQQMNKQFKKQTESMPDLSRITEIAEENVQWMKTAYTEIEGWLNFAEFL